MAPETPPIEYKIAYQQIVSSPQRDNSRAFNKGLILLIKTRVNCRFIFKLSEDLTATVPPSIAHPSSTTAEGQRRLLTFSSGQKYKSFKIKFVAIQKHLPVSCALSHIVGLLGVLQITLLRLILIAAPLLKRASQQVPPKQKNLKKPWPIYRLKETP